MSSATDIESPEHDGKWAEEESDESSVDEFDSVSNKGGRREEFKARKALALEGRKPQQEGDTVEGRLTKSSDGGESKKMHAAAKTKASSSAKTAKKGKIRFKEEGKTPGNQKVVKDRDRKKIVKKGQEVDNEEDKKEDASDGVEPKEEKRNKYLDEWLGIKREVEDTRYQPGKPPPNRLVQGRSEGGGGVLECP